RRRSILPCRIRRRYETSFSSWVRSSIRRLRSSSESEARSGNASTEVHSSEERALLVHPAAARRVNLSLRLRLRLRLRCRSGGRVAQPRGRFRFRTLGLHDLLDEPAQLGLELGRSLLRLA